MKKTIVICSGGCDSVTLLHKAVKELGKENVHTLYFYYGGKHNDVEKVFSKKNSELLGIPYIEIDLSYIGKLWKSNLLKGGDKIPEGHYSENIMAKTVVSFRNGIMLANAVGFCESIGFDEVWLGSHQGDRAQYPDCTLEFTQAINLASILGTSKKIKIVSPFNEWMKWDIIEWGLKNGIDYKLTHSCYNGQKEPCGHCSTCVEASESFYRNCSEDPRYSSKEKWEEAKQFMLKIVEEFNKQIVL